jgi:CheY-like chemotaxis protein/tetratricopeptide (TPR) repeat protein
MSEMSTILYIDDNLQVPAGFEEDLRTAGYRLLHTSDPDEALILIRVEEIDLVLAEVILSSCNGIALLEEIRSYGGWPAEVPIIVLTKGERTPDLYGGALEVGVTEFFTKPALKKELLESVKQYAGGVSKSTDVNPSEASSSPEGEAAIVGDLAEIPISEVLRRLRRDAASGVLTVVHRKDRKAFELRNGSPVAASASGGVEAPEKFLARRERISQAQCGAVRELVDAGQGSCCEILVELGALSEEEFIAAIREQAEEQLLETFRWTSGSFQYFPDRHVRPDVALEIGRDQAALMFEGGWHWSPHEMATEALQSQASRYVSQVEEPPCDPAELDLAASERSVFEDLYGTRSVQAVLDSGDLDARTLYALFVAGLLVFHDEPVMMLLDAVPASEEPLPDVVREVSASEEPLDTAREEFTETGLEEDLDEDLGESLDAARSEFAEAGLGEDLDEDLEESLDVERAEFAEAGLGEDLEDSLEVESTEFADEDLEADLEAGPREAWEEDLEVEPDLGQAEGSVVAPPPARAVESIAPSWNTERALAELTAFCDYIREKDDFDVLGISVDATDAEVYHARESLLDTLPSEEAAAELAELKDLVGEARARIDKAFDRLRLSNSRSVYAQLRPQAVKVRKQVRVAKTPEQIAAEKAAYVEDLASRGLDAEAWFRTGNDYFESKSYEPAVEAYGMAAHLDPKEGEYLARLGYAQFLHQPKDPVVLKEALENIANGIKLSPCREKPYVYLGKIFRANGAEDRARKMFENAVRMKPDCHEALQELGLLDPDGAKSGKLINRLKGILT